MLRSFERVPIYPSSAFGSILHYIRPFLGIYDHYPLTYTLLLFSSHNLHEAEAFRHTTWVAAALHTYIHT